MSDSTRSHFALLMRLCKWLKCLCMIGAISYGIHAIPYYREALPGQPALSVHLHAVPSAFESSAVSSLQNKHHAYGFAPHLLFLDDMLLFCATQLSSSNVSSPVRTLESRGHGICVTRFTKRELKRSFSLLSRKLYAIIYKRVRIRYTTTAYGLWSQARVHWVAQGHGVTGCFPWCGRQGSFLSSYLLYKFLSLQLNSLNLIAREGFWPQVSLSLPCSILNSGWYRTFYSVCAIE